MKKLVTTLEQVKTLVDKAISLVGDSAVEGVKLPASVDDIAELSADDAKSLAEQLNINVEGKKPSAIRKLLTTLVQIKQEDDDVDDADVNALAEACDIKVSKKVSSTVKALIEFFGESEEVVEEDDSEDGDSDDDESEESEESEEDSDEDSDESEDSDEDESEEESEEEEESEDEEESEEEESEDEDSDEDESEEEESDEESDEDESEESDEDSDESEAPDTAAIVKKVKKLPKPDVMKSRLAAYNKVAKKKIKETGEAGYRKLLELLVDADGEIAEWGTPYASGNEYFCCGLPLNEVKLKGKKGNFGKCAVSGKTFSVSDDGELSEVE